MMKVELNSSERASIARLVEMAREEDLGPGDVTALLFENTSVANGRFVARQEMVFCGTEVLQQVAAAYDSSIDVHLLVDDGSSVSEGDILAEWSGPASSLMAAERPSLNFLQRLGGIATITRRYVDLVADTSAGIYDTRKTLPGWRDLEKYAVRAGGGHNHRRGLYDAAMIKDNHLKAADAYDPAKIADSLSAIRQSLPPGGFIVVEVDTLKQLESALKLPIEIVLLDNMSTDDLRKAVALRDTSGSGIQLEASGGITLENVRQVAETGVERISIGALTHSAPAVDIGLDMD